MLAAMIRSAPFEVVIRVLERMDSGREGVLPVLTYHRIANDPSVGYPGLISAAPKQFDQQMAFLARRYRVVSMTDLLEAREGRRSILPRSVLVTFDDAYRDFGEYAWPIMRNRGLPVTLFVPTAYPGHPDRGFWWDWLHQALQASHPAAAIETPTGSMSLETAADRADAFRVLRAEVKSRPHIEAMELVADIAEQLAVAPPASSVLTWPALRTLAAEGVTLAPHSREHPLLDRIDSDRLDNELRGSWNDLRTEIGETMPVLAYPSGAYSNDVRAAAQRIGFRVAFTTRRGLNNLDRADWLSLRRINVGPRSSLNAIRTQLGTWALLWSR